MTDETIRPALTPEEWADGGLTLAASGAESLEADRLADGRLQIDGWVLDHRRQRALAALALHGQPFGFTWADVDLLHASANNWATQARHAPNTAREVAWMRTAADAQRQLAAKIAALLPPRDATP